MRVAIIGYGNVGQFVAQAVEAAPDMNLVGVVRRDASQAADGYRVTDHIEALLPVDVAILCTPTRLVEATALKLLALGIHTVDSYDIHQSIVELRRTLDAAAKTHNAVSVISSGWDPGSDSVVRALLEACAPRGITYTDFGPGMSMGHSVAAKAVDGVKSALSMTIPQGTGLHRRLVYVELEEGAVFDEVQKAILSDPYFSHDDTHVIAVDDVASLQDRGHGVHMTRKGVSGITDNQLFTFQMRINNPALTAQVMVAAARASMKQQPGAYTLIEIPVVDFLPGEREDLIRRLV